MTTVRVIACGNPDAGDDAVGFVVGEELARRGLDVVFARAAVDVLDRLDDVDVAIVIDAVRTPGGGRAPGTLIRAEADDDGRLPAELRSSLSSHGLGVGEAIGLAGALGHAPSVVVHGVEAGDVTVGAPLSAAVRGAVPQLVSAVVADVERLTADASDTP
jgi:hydrogenase maturation protease